ncbi:uncharacterized protein LOC128960249 [Oppia nitens]|uniref:uncharacterized protein LOC128960249 n=1 Tax=Oppia nitens TaxID=1686743 RepID=UPI0023DCC15E|nr:uncharacterized protein LOC128960249 [Oppia nitens]
MDFNERRFDKRVMTSKNKWIKAFRTLKIVTTTGDRSETNESSSSSSRLSFPVGQHVFQENTYKKITACDVCREILRGHSRQGLKCKLCKMNVHSGQCQENAPKCQPKPRLLRKQKSASELEVKQTIGDIEDKALESNLDTMGDSLGDVYPTQHRLSTAEEFYESKHMSNIVSLSNEEVYDTRRIFGGDDSYEIRRSERIERPDRCERSSADNRWNNRPIVEISSETTENTNRQIAPIITHEKSSAPHSRSRSNASSSGSSPSYLLAVKTQLHAYSAPHSPQRKKLSLRMKSLSLDSPESTEHVLSCRKQVSHQMPQYNNTYNNQCMPTFVIFYHLF